MEPIWQIMYLTWQRFRFNSHFLFWHLVIFQSEKVIGYLIHPSLSSLVHTAMHFKIMNHYLPRFHHSFHPWKCKQIERRAFPLAKNWPSIELQLNALRWVLWVHRVLWEDNCLKKMFGTLPSSQKLFKFYADTQEIIDEVQMFYVEDKSGITGLLSSSTGDKEW